MSAFDRMVDPEVREVRRLEVITGALGAASVERRSKARIVAESLAPGVMMSEAAGRHDPRPQQLFAWRHQARQGRLALPNCLEKETPVIARLLLRTTVAPPGEEAPSRCHG